MPVIRSASALPSSPSSCARTESMPSSSSRDSSSPSQPHSTVRSLCSTWKVRPWSTPWRWPSVISRMCAPLRSALLTTMSKTAIRRSAAESSWMRATGRSSSSVPSKTWRQPSSGTASRGHEVDGVLVGVGFAPELHHPAGRAGRRAARCAARCSSRTPPRRGRRRPRGRRACRPGSPTAASRRRSACRRPERRRDAPRKVAFEAMVMRPVSSSGSTTKSGSSVIRSWRSYDVVEAGQTWPSGSIGLPHSGHSARPAPTTSSVREANARAVPTGIRTTSISAGSTSSGSIDSSSSSTIG